MKKIHLVVKNCNSLYKIASKGLSKLDAYTCVATYLLKGLQFEFQ